MTSIFRALRVGFGMVAVTAICLAAYAALFIAAPIVKMLGIRFPDEPA